MSQRSGQFDPTHHCTTPTDQKVFIIEDEHVARRALQSLLRASGYEASAYETAEQALADLDRGHVPAVVVVDVDLPGMSGLELIDRIEAMFPHLKIVLTTAVDGGRIDNFRKTHQVHYLRKPLDFARLLEFLARTNA